MTTENQFENLKTLAAQIEALGTCPASFKARWDFGKAAIAAMESGAGQRALVAATGVNMVYLNNYIHLVRWLPTEEALGQRTAKYRNWNQLTTAIERRIRDAREAAAEQRAKDAEAKMQAKIDARVEQFLTEHLDRSTQAHLGDYLEAQPSDMPEPERLQAAIFDLDQEAIEELEQDGRLDAIEAEVRGA